jgi:NADH-quinone oxidoreductase subunit L
VVIHRVGSNDIATMGGLRGTLPVTFWTTTVGLAALAGVPPIGGFFSKESVLGAAYDTATGSPASAGVPAAAGWLVLLAGLLTALLTAAYATRAWLMVFFGERGELLDVSPSAPVTPVDVEPPAPPAPAHGEAPWTELVPLVLLAVGAVLIGVIGLDRAWLPTWLGGADGVRIASSLAPSLAPSMVTTVLSLACLGVGVTAVTLAWRADPEADPARLLGVLRAPSESGFGFDRAQHLVVVVPVRAAARLVMFLDHEVVDAYVRGSGTGARLAGGALRRVQNGNAQWYLTGALAGALVVAVAFAL